MPDVKFTPEDLSLAECFAVKAAPFMSQSVCIELQEQERRIKVGKLGEIAFKRHLEKNNRIPLGCDDMWEVFKGKGDETDFKAKDGKKIDIKTASSHLNKWLRVPATQFENQPKHYYVSVRLHPDKKGATLDGYATRDEVQQSGKKIQKDGKEAYQHKCQNLHPISELLKRFPLDEDHIATLDQTNATAPDTTQETKAQSKHPMPSPLDQKDDSMPAPSSPPLKPTVDHVHAETALLEQWPTFSGYKCSWTRDSNGFPNFIFTAEEEIAEKREKNGDLWWSVKDDTALTGYRKVLEIKILGRRRPSHKRITTLVWILIALTVINLPSTLNTLRQYIALLSPWLSSTLHNLP
ncbi:MAG: hypothetical protein OXI80_00100 [Caldilineaceae bacterium]|nr:hypothetical protein [Caldilineaceae bacterium]MDE0336042.1 hypothetical protein [Caldilineaceae bacterium]